MSDSDIANIMRASRVSLSDEEIGRLAREAAGYERIERNPDGSFKERDPKTCARTAFLAPFGLGFRNGWDEVVAALSAKFAGTAPIAYIFGGGVSALGVELEALNGQFVYGINWTRKWFNPSMLQIMDDMPLRSQVIENPWPIMSVLVTSQTLWKRHASKGRLDGVPHALFDCRDLHNDHRSFAFPDHPWEPLEHYSNSLGIALQIVYGLGFRKIVLIGFDFGGEHFFGDGKSEGCANHYGLAGDTKPDLHVKLLALAHVLRGHGCKVAQVGATKLEWAFDQFATVEEAHAHLRA